MKKFAIICITVLTLFSGRTLFAQGAHDATVRFGKVDRPGFMAEYPLQADLIGAALRERLGKGGLGKPKSDKGFVSYQAATWSEVSASQLDVYTLVEGKGANSTVVVLVSKGYDNFVSTASDSPIAEKVKAFLNSFIDDARAYQLKQLIEAQAAAIYKAEKAYNKANDEGDKLAREKEHIEKQQAENAREKGQLAEALSAEKAKMADLQRQQK